MSSRHLAAFLLLASTVAVIGSFCAVPVGTGVEEHFALGRRLHETGSLGARLLRPPGYPAFVATVLWTRDALSAAGALRFDDAFAVSVAQRLALLLCSGFVFRQALRDRSPFAAFCLATLFSCNPLSVVLSGTLSYPLLDMLLVCLGTLLLARITSEQPRWWPAGLLAGVVWGLAAMVRPVALALPGFVLGIGLLRRPGSWRHLLAVTGALALGMASIVGPYTLRNFALTGRLVPVCAQGGFALWGSSAARPTRGAAYVDWRRIWQKQGLPIYTRITGHKEYSLDLLTQYAPELDAAFRSAALANITRHPETYLFNVVNNLCRYPLDTSDWWWQRFLWVNAGRPWDSNGVAPPAAASWPWIRLADALVVALSVCGLAGIVVGLWRSDPWAEPILVVYAMSWVGHGLTFTMSRYTYARLPLLVLALGMLLRPPSTAPSEALVGITRLATVLVAILVGLAIVSSLGLILAH
jgi:hypothetical protein